MQEKFERNINAMIKRSNFLKENEKEITRKANKLLDDYDVNHIATLVNSYSGRKLKGKLNKIGKKFSNDFSKVMKDIHSVYSHLNDMAILAEEHEELKKVVDMESNIDDINNELHSTIFKNTALHNNIVRETKPFINVMRSTLNDKFCSVVDLMYTQSIWEKPVEHFNKNKSKELKVDKSLVTSGN